ncbi:MAG: tetratricopeptide repeat protein [Thermoguttaceae bacterium]|jgi:tetratricopeptide (TPR) repeat protein
MNRTITHLPVFFLLMLVAILVAPSGCGPADGSPTKITNRSADTSSQWSEDLFSFALENLNHLEDNDCEEMLRSTQQRLAVLKQPKIALGILPPDNLLASWPEPDMLRQVVSRLNQWVDTQEKPAESMPDPMLATLPADLLKLPMVENVGQVHYTAYDGYMLMEAVWLRDASRSKWAGGGSADELQVARSLFDWTICNIQTDYDSPDRVPQVPWETLFLGHGTSWERAWTYILLLRQRGIDAALLALPEEDSSPTKQSGKGSLKPWCVGVLIGDKEKRIYLFDPKLGLPIPAPGGIVADKSGRLDIQPATLDQVVANPKLLDRLTGDAPYWARNADLKRVIAWVEASPLYVSPRAKRIESRLTGEQRLVLNAEPSQQAAHFKAAGVGNVRLWELPYTTLQRRFALEPNAVIQRLLAYEPFMSSPSTTSNAVAPLYKGRIMHLKGRFFDEKEAIACYQKARPRTSNVVEDAPKIAKASYDFLSQQQRKARGRDLTPAEEQFLKQVAADFTEQQVDAIIRGKLAASYWLGLIQYEQGEFAAALDYFSVRTLQFPQNWTKLEWKPRALAYFSVGALQLGPKIFWATGAHYNIARILEAGGQRQKAIDVYETSILLRNDSGNLVRARWLKELDGEEHRKPEEKKTVEKKIEETKTVKE